MAREGIYWLYKYAEMRCHSRSENSETMYLKYQENIEGNSSLEGENVKML